MKPQELFNTVAKHLLKQNKKSEDSGFCMYLSKDTCCKCAAGCLIPPEKYDPKWEGISVRSIPFFVEEACENDDVTLDLLIELQKLHDDTEVASWRKKLIMFAYDYSLDDSVCKEIS